MAALTRHGPLNFFAKRASTDLIRTAATGTRLTPKRDEKKRGGQVIGAKRTPDQRLNRLNPTQESLAARGFLRAYRPYEPPEDVTTRIDRICDYRGIGKNREAKLEDPVQRFRILADCSTEFKHSVPNSQLYTIETVGDLKEFYLKPVDTVTPLEALRRLDLPKNLHIRYEYHRFHPETDTLFGGKTAFPASSTIVTGLKYKKKYPGHQQDDPYLSESMRI